jgi:hypothetical protein
MFINAIHTRIIELDEKKKKKEEDKKNKVQPQQAL